MKVTRDLDNNIWFGKILSIGISMGILILVYLLNVGYHKYLWGYIGSFLFLSWILSCGWASLFHYWIFKQVFQNYNFNKEIKMKKIKVYIKEYAYYEMVRKGKKNKSKKEILVRNIKYGILNAFSPDYFFARVFKYSLENNNSYNEECLNRKFYRVKRGCEGIPGEKKPHLYLNEKIKCEYNLKEDRYDCEKHQEKKRLQKFVIYSNWVNVFSICILFILSMILDWSLNSDDTNKLIKFTFIFVTVRLMSRAIEVAIAFYSDVVRTKMTRDLSIGERSTNLKRGHRISLVVHTYFEFVILFSILYFLEPIWINGNALAGLRNYIDFVLYSASVSAFNISFDTTSLTSLGKIIHTLQVFLCINLIVLSIATYLGFQDKMNSFEKADWRKENQD
ncbi:hypothetical protein [Bacillus cereus]|uniref:hypothetical protein n=1 Tax=Bacillus cereus TaxID=1396 RepID=UPI000BF64EFB|nr:hypothetical protein [Bacillus cereus]PEX21874.1 hypothetical protein CN458_27770 [Bacillus cereus]HDR3495917.1 hypothetical protein [Bacillus toyonensis]HDR7697240.1 hypothetical protein [Bacillus toyonensis]